MDNICKMLLRFIVFFCIVSNHIDGAIIWYTWHGVAYKASVTDETMSVEQCKIKCEKVSTCISVDYQVAKQICDFNSNDLLLAVRGSFGGSNQYIIDRNSKRNCPVRFLEENFVSPTAKNDLKTFKVYDIGNCKYLCAISCNCFAIEFIKDVKNCTLFLIDVTTNTISEDLEDSSKFIVLPCIDRNERCPVEWSEVQKGRFAINKYTKVDGLFNLDECKEECLAHKSCNSIYYRNKNNLECHFNDKSNSGQRKMVDEYHILPCPTTIMPTNMLSTLLSNPLNLSDFDFRGATCQDCKSVGLGCADVKMCINTCENVNDTKIACKFMTICKCLEDGVLHNYQCINRAKCYSIYKAKENPEKKTGQDWLMWLIISLAILTVGSLGIVALVLVIRRRRRKGRIKLRRKPGSFTQTKKTEIRFQSETRGH